MKDRLHFECGFTRMPNELLEALMRLYLPNEAWRVFLAVIRKTFGFHKKRDFITHGQIARMTGIDRRNVHRAVKILEQIRMIRISAICPDGEISAISSDGKAAVLSDDGKRRRKRRSTLEINMSCKDWRRYSEVAISSDAHKRNYKVSKESEETAPLSGGGSFSSEPKQTTKPVIRDIGYNFREHYESYVDEDGNKRWRCLDE